MEGLHGTRGASPRHSSPRERPHMIHMSPRRSSPHGGPTLSHGQSGCALPSCCRLEQSAPEVIFPLQEVREGSGSLVLGQGQVWLRKWEERQTARLEKHHKAMEQELKGLREAMVEHSEHHFDNIQKLLRSELARERGFQQMSEVSASLHAAGTNGKLEPTFDHSLVFGKSLNLSDQHLPATSERTVGNGGKFAKSKSAWRTTMSMSFNEELAAACGVADKKYGEFGCSSTHASSALGYGIYSDIEASESAEFRPKLDCQRALAKVVHSPAFTFVSIAVILLYTLAMGVQTDVDMRRTVNGEYEPFDFFLILDIIFTVIFAVEVALRMAAELGWFFKGPARFWNIFDLIIVFCNLIEILSILDVNLGYLRIVRGLRVVRAFRMLRVLSSFRTLRLMTVSIASSMVSLLWAFVLLVLFMYIFAIVLLQGAGDYLRNTEGVASATSETLREDFGTMAKAVFSLTQAISGGRSWGEFAKPFLEISPWYGLGFTLFVVFVVFGTLNILTGIFVASTRDLYHYDQELVIQEEVDQRDSVIGQIRSLFLEIDTDKSGTISFEELKAHLKDKRVQAYFSVLQLDVSKAEGLFRLLDKDGNGDVSIEEFIVNCMRLKGQARSIDMASMLFEHKRLYRMMTHWFEGLDTDVRQLTHQIHAWRVAQDRCRPQNNNNNNINNNNRFED